MNSLSYIIKRSCINNFKKFSKKPSSYAVIIIIVLYVYYIITAVLDAVNAVDSAEMRHTLLFGILLFLVLMSYTAGLSSIAKKRAVLFNTADVHFAFSGPISPKVILLYSYGKSLLVSSIIYCVIFIFGVSTLQIPIMTQFMVLIGCLLMEVCEVALIMIVYGKQDDTGRISKYVSWFVRATTVFLPLYVLYMYFIQNVGLDIARMINNPVVFLLPLIGWAISLFYTILIEVSLIPLIGSILFIIITIALAIYAYALKTQGEFYEEASSFAEEYSQRKKRAKKGEASISWKRKKLRKANVIYKGSGAKAILYRQILEYKKQPFFIFGFKSIMNLLISLAIAYFGYNYGTFLNEIPISLSYIIIGIMAYVSFLSSGYATKWSKEIDVIYTFMIPDKPFSKLWYSTLVEHIRSLVDGILFVVPAAWGLKIGVVEAICCIGIYIVLESTKLYLQIINQTIIRNIVGKTIAGFVQMLLQLPIIIGGVYLLGMGEVNFSVPMAMLITILFGAVISVVCCGIAATQFERMDSGE